MDISAFIQAVGSTPLSVAMQRASWTISTLQSIHIFTLAVVFTSAAAVDLRLLGVAAKDQPLERLTARFFPAVGWGLALLAVSGLLLMIAEPNRAITNLYFQIKMAALLVVGVGTWALGRSVALNPDRWRAPEKRALSKVLAVASLALWALIIVAGRWIAYGP